ncbi:MAG: hypothetical protein EXR70_16395 [Deltaproteobacteria bacterium]|nr:hypothetical protein [Deltaproteobacteria bacterium]
MPAKAGIQPSKAGWIPACAGMTDYRIRKCMSVFIKIATTTATSRESCSALLRKRYLLFETLRSVAWGPAS